MSSSEWSVWMDIKMWGRRGGDERTPQKAISEWGLMAAAPAAPAPAALRNTHPILSIAFGTSGFRDDALTMFVF